MSDRQLVCAGCGVSSWALTHHVEGCPETVAVSLGAPDRRPPATRVVARVDGLFGVVEELEFRHVRPAPPAGPFLPVPSRAENGVPVHELVEARSVRGERFEAELGPSRGRVEAQAAGLYGRVTVYRRRVRMGIDT